MGIWLVRPLTYTGPQAHAFSFTHSVRLSISVSAITVYLYKEIDSSLRYTNLVIWSHK